MGGDKGLGWLSDGHDKHLETKVSPHTRKRGSWAATLIVVGALFLLWVPSASAQTSISGTWSCCGSGGAGEQTWEINESGSGSLSGTGYDPGTTTVFATITGNVSGSNVTITTTYTSVSYTATFIGTVSAGSGAMSGTWSDTHNVSGTWTATLTGGATLPTPTPTPPTGSRRSATQVNCYDTNPGAIGDYFQCTAATGDASGQSPADTPTGKVAFAINPGGGGGFQGLSSCTLVPSQTGGPTSFCSVNYLPPTGGVPIGSQPPVTATYSGDKIFASSNGQPQTQKAIEASLCSQVYDPICSGLTALPLSLADTCVSLTGCSPGVQDEGTEAVTISEDEKSLVVTTKLPTLTPAEWEAYLSTPNPDPDLAARVKYINDYNTFSNSVNTVRADVLQSIQDSLAKAAANSSSFGSVTFSAASALWTPYINELIDAAAAAGTAVGTPNLSPIKDDFCTSAQDPPGCAAAVQAVRDYVAGAIDVLKTKKGSLGVDVPYTPPPKSAKQQITPYARGSRVSKTKQHTVRTVVIARSKLVKLAVGKKNNEKKLIHLPITASVRAELNQALGGRHTRTLHAQFVVVLSTPSEGFTTRTIPVRIRLIRSTTKHH